MDTVINGSIAAASLALRGRHMRGLEALDRYATAHSLADSHISRLD